MLPLRHRFDLPLWFSFPRGICFCRRLDRHPDAHPSGNGTKNRPSVHPLRKYNQPHPLDLPGSFDRKSHRPPSQILQAPNPAQRPHHARVMQRPPAVLALPHLGRLHRVDQRRIEISLCRRGRPLEAHQGAHLPAIHLYPGKLELNRPTLRSLLNCLPRRPSVRADELPHSAHHHLRRKHIVQVEPRPIRLLPVRELRGRKPVVPPQTVPVVDMLLEHDDLGPGHWLLLVQPGQQGICRRTARASLRRK